MTRRTFLQTALAVITAAFMPRVLQARAEDDKVSLRPVNVSIGVTGFMAALLIVFMVSPLHPGSYYNALSPMTAVPSTGTEKSLHPVNATMAAATSGSAAAAVSCGGLDGTYMFNWTGDFTSDTNQACNNAADTTGINGTVASGTAISGTYGETGNGMLMNRNGADQISWTVTSNANLNAKVPGTIYMRVKMPVDITGGCYILTAVGNDTHIITMWIATTMKVWGKVKDAEQLIDNSSVSSNAVVADTWTTIGYSWDSGVSRYCSVLVGTTWADDATCFPVGPVAPAYDTAAIYLGNVNYGGGDPGANGIYIDKIAVVSGYKASLPSGW